MSITVRILWRNNTEYWVAVHQAAGRTRIVILSLLVAKILPFLPPLPAIWKCNSKPYQVQEFTTKNVIAQKGKYTTIVIIHS